jgi:hypothetical protein
MSSWFHDVKIRTVQYFVGAVILSSFGSVYVIVKTASPDHWSVFLTNFIGAISAARLAMSAIETRYLQTGTPTSMRPAQVAYYEVTILVPGSWRESRRPWPSSSNTVFIFAAPGQPRFFIHSQAQAVAASPTIRVCVTPS